MTIDEAIRCNGDILCYHREVLTKAQIDAIKLGIEVLKQLRDWRKGGVLGLDEPLLGETE